jgi:outer membrane protein
MSRITIGRQSRPRVARTSRALAALAVLIAGSTAWAQEVRIGYVDMKVLFDTAPQIDSAREALDQEFTPRNEAVVADEVRLERMEADLAAAENLSAEERYEMEREIRNLRRSIERRREDLNEEMRFRVNAEKKELEETIEVAVRQVAEEGDFDLILTSPVAFASERIDVTDRVLQWLEEDFRNQRNDVEGAP